MRTLTTALTVISLLVVSGCTPLSAVTMVGSAVNQIIQYSESQTYISDTRTSTVVDPNAVAASNLNLGIEYMRLEKYELALERLRRAREAKPDYALVYDVLGLLHQRMGQPDVAEQYFLHALKLDGENSSTLNNYGQFLCTQDRVDEAEQRFLAAAENPLYDAPEIPYTNIGTCAYLHGEPDKAGDYFTRALSLNPHIPPALITLSEINYDRRQYLPARDYLDRYLKYREQSPRSLWLGIRIEHELGDKDKVSSYALLLRNQYPDSDEAKLLAESGIR